PAVEERAEVDEGAEDVVLLAAGGVPVVFRFAGSRLGEQALDGARLDVVAEDQAADLFERIEARLGGQGVEADALTGAGIGGRERLEDEQRRAGADLGVAAHQELAHAAGGGGEHGGLDLHRFQHDERLAGLDRLAFADGQGDHDGRCRRAHYAAGVARDAVGDAVDLHQQVAALRRHRGVPAPAAAGEAPAGTGRRLDARFDRLSFQLQPVVPRTEAADAEEVGVAAMPQFDPAPDLARYVGPAADGGG